MTFPCTTVHSFIIFIFSKIYIKRYTPIRINSYVFCVIIVLKRLIIYGTDLFYTDKYL